MAYSKSKVSNFGRGRFLAGFEYCHQVSHVTGEVPLASELAVGEVAINTADRALYFKSASGDVLSLPTPEFGQVGSTGVGVTLNDGSPGTGILIYDTPNDTQALYGATSLYLPGLPTSDPQAAGYVWNDAGTLKVSAGAT